jgi:hypothetical protein
MNKERLLILASNSKMLRNLTAKLCNYREIQHDMFQEFMLYLCEKDESYLLKKYEDAMFIGYCVLTIKTINSHRLKANTLINTKNVLAEKNNFCELKDMPIDCECYNHEIDIKFEKAVKFAKSNKFKAEVLFKSVVTSTREIASDLGINQRKLIYENNKFKKELREKLK